MVGLDFRNLVLDGRVISWKTTNATERLGSLVLASLFDEESRSLWQDQESCKEHQGPSELDGDGNTVAASVVAVGSGIVDNGGKEKTDGDGPLVGTDNGTTDPFGCCLGLVEGN